MQDLEMEVKRLRNLLKRVIKKLPNERVSYSGVGWCAGCGTTLWVSGDPTPRDPCKPDCVLQEALREINKPDDSA